MTNLHKLQESIDTITALLQQVEALQPRTADKLMGNQTATAYNTEEVTNLQYQITQWGLDTYNIADKPSDTQTPTYNTSTNAGAPRFRASTSKRN